ncbi:guanylate-binding protein 1-like isoform X1 [Tachysurus ichikawai]
MSHQQRLQQLEKKFEDKKHQQQQELNIALERKLAEQKDLIQKGFDEKAKLLGREIEHLKKEKPNDNPSGGIFKDYVMPLVDTAKDVFPFEGTRRCVRADAMGTLL